MSSLGRLLKPTPQKKRKNHDCHQTTPEIRTERLHHQEASFLAVFSIGLSPVPYTYLCTNNRGKMGIKMERQIARLGRNVIAFLTAVGEITLYCRTSFRTALRGQLDWPRTCWEMNTLGVKASPIVVLINTFAGMVISLHLSSSFAAFGLSAQMGHLLTIAFARELAPVLTGVVVAGRAGSAIAAEIGTMAVSEQIDALKTLGINPHVYLIAPKILAAFLMLPLLIVIANLTGLLGGMGLAIYMKNITALTFIDSILTYIKPWDFLGGMIKGFFFGLVVAGIGIYYGLHTQNGAAGVGTAATKTVVTGISALFIINFLLTMLFY